jgi:hypothetical protein
MVKKSERNRKFNKSFFYVTFLRVTQTDRHLCCIQAIDSILYGILGTNSRKIIMAEPSSLTLTIQRIQVTHSLENVALYPPQTSVL